MRLPGLQLWARRPTRTARACTGARHDKAIEVPTKRLPLIEESTTIDDCSAQVFSEKYGASERKAFVISVPKSGTYLLARVLHNLGIVDLEIHASEACLTDYRNRSNVEKVEQPRQFARMIPLEIAAQMILPGQFMVGHIPFSQKNREVLRSFARFLCIRELRQSLVSFMRFQYRRLKADPEHHPNKRFWIEEPTGPPMTRAFLSVYGAEHLSLAGEVFKWTSESGTVVCRFEDLLGDNGAASRQQVAGNIAAALGFERQAGYFAVCDALGKETLTYSGSRSYLDGFWDAKVEAYFRELGGVERNRVLGYPD